MIFSGSKSNNFIKKELKNTSFYGRTFCIVCFNETDFYMCDLYLVQGDDCKKLKENVICCSCCKTEGWGN